MGKYITVVLGFIFIITCGLSLFGNHFQDDLDTTFILGLGVSTLVFEYIRKKTKV